MLGDLVEHPPIVPLEGLLVHVLVAPRRVVPGVVHADVDRHQVRGEAEAVLLEAGHEVGGLVPADAAVQDRRVGFASTELLRQHSHVAVAEAVRILPSAAVGDRVADEQEDAGRGGRAHGAHGARDGSRRSSSPRPASGPVRRAALSVRREEPAAREAIGLPESCMDRRLQCARRPDSSGHLIMHQSPRDAEWDPYADAGFSR